MASTWSQVSCLDLQQRYICSEKDSMRSYAVLCCARMLMWEALKLHLLMTSGKQCVWEAQPWSMLLTPAADQFCSPTVPRLFLTACPHLQLTGLQLLYQWLSDWMLKYTCTSCFLDIWPAEESLAGKIKGQVQLLHCQQEIDLDDWLCLFWMIFYGAAMFQDKGHNLSRSSLSWLWRPWERGTANDSALFLSAAWVSGIPCG